MKMKFDHVLVAALLLSFLGEYAALQGIGIRITALNVRRHVQSQNRLFSMQVSTGRSNGRHIKRDFSHGKGSGNGNSAPILQGEGRSSNPSVKKRVALDQRKGARPLTPTERKTKEKLDASRMPGVDRVAYTSRTLLSNLAEGQQLRGRVISVTEFGMFVDVGTQKDGLVHIKDVSKDYFIQDLKSRFVAGQDIDVWVKFVDGDRWKLGLQLFPVDHRLLDVATSDIVSSKSLTGARLPVASLNVEDAVTGTVVKVSNFGVFVDIGCAVDAFLPRRKMKIGRKRRSERPWELHPIGSQVSCFVHKVDSMKNRLSLTTYSPEDWDDVLLSKSSEAFDDGDNMMITDDSEELGGSSRAANLLALERTLALSLDDEDDLDYDDTMSDGEDEVFEDEELMFSDADGVDRAQVLIDDFDDGQRRKMKGSSIVNSKDTKNNAEDDLSLDELFEDLSMGKNYVTMRDLFRWDYLKEVYDDGEVDDETLQTIFREAGGKSGKLKEELFPGFVNSLADFLGLENEEIDANVFADTLDDKTSTSQSLNHDAGDLGSNLNKVIEEDNTDSDFAELQAEFSSTGIASSDKDLNKLYESKPSSNDVMKYVFDGVAGKKGHVTFKDILAWDFVQSFRKTNAISDTELEKLFTKAAGKSKSTMDRQEFTNLLDSLIEFENLPRKRTLESTTGEVLKPNTGTISVIKGNRFAAPETVQNIEEEESILGDKDNDDDFDVRELFGNLCDDENSETISLSSALSWEPVQDLISSGAIDTDEFKIIFQQAAGDETSGLDLHGFNDLLNLLSPLFADDEDLEEEGEEEENGEQDALSFLLDDTENSEELYAISDKEPEISRESVSAIISKKLNDVSDDQFRKEINFENESEEKILRDVFNNLANGKDKVSLKNLLNWDLVLDLFAESLLTEEILQSKINECGGNSKGIDIKGFDKLVDVLIQLYADGESSPENMIVQSVVPPRPLMTPNPSDTLNLEPKSSETAIMTGYDGVIDEVFDIDVEEAFDEVSQGKDYVTFKDVTEWYVVQEMKNAGVLTNIMVRQLFEEVGITEELDGSEKIDPATFQSFLDLLCEQLSDDIDDLDDDGPSVMS